MVLGADLALPPLRGAVFAQCACRRSNARDLAFSQELQGRPVIQPGIWLQHELNLHPGVVFLQVRQDLFKALQRSATGDLPAGIDIAMSANVQSDEAIGSAPFVDGLPAQVQELCHLLGRKGAALSFKQALSRFDASHPRRSQRVIRLDGRQRFRAAAGSEA